MSVARCKLLMSYLPGIAAVVNSFQSPEVQLAVYQTLITALDERIAEDPPRMASPPMPGPSTSRSSTRPTSPSDTDIVHDLVEGDSIHSLVG